METSSLPFLSLQQSFPEAARQLQERVPAMEAQLKDAAQVDFVLAEGQLRLSAPTPLERGPQAALKIAVSLVEEGLISRHQALLRVKPEEVRQLLLPSFEVTEVRQAVRQGRLLTLGEGVRGGVVSGRLALDSETACRLHQLGEPVVLVCEQLTYLERDALSMVSGVIVAGGPTLAAQQFERACVVAPELRVEQREARFSAQGVPEGETVSVDAFTGQVFSGPLRVVSGELTSDAASLLGWADEVRQLEIRANICSLEDARLAVRLGAAGIGLCRIESLFQTPARLPLFQTVLREICLTGSESSSTLDQLTREIEDDFHQLLLAARGTDQTPFAVRLLDAPVSQMMAYWKDCGQLPADYFRGTLGVWLRELNPMQGLRCGRLSILFPALMKLQVRALLRAWDRASKQAASIRLQMMMPGVCDVQEIRILRTVVGDVCAQEGLQMPEIGSMLEVPRACLTAGTLCEEADFLSFGTGDLTESTCGISRYDSQLSFLPGYLEEGIFTRDPFQSIDQPGVGALMQFALERVKQKCPSVEMGTCGAQAVDPESLAFCCRLGLNYASVPVHHLPVARLAAAQAVLRKSDQKV